MSDVILGSRQPVLSLLERHLPRAFDAHETAMVAQVIAFVRREPACFERSCEEGHLTGSAWIVTPARSHVLLCHHAKLDRWLQLGGHADGDPDLAAVARKEAEEESGLRGLRAISPEIFDVDCHRIPARKTDPEHWHFDLRFLFEADLDEPLVVSAESRALAWVLLSQVAHYSREASLARMVAKTKPVL